MTVPHIFATQPAGNVPASYLDADFAAVLAGTAGSFVNMVETGTWSFGGDNFFANSWQPGNSYGDFVVPLNGTTYVDNVLTIENASSDGLHVGNAAFRYRDNIVHAERAAIGYSHVNTGNPNIGGYYPNLFFIGIGGLGPVVTTTASISGTTLTVTAADIDRINVGQTVNGAGVTSGTVIDAYLGGTGGVGTYTVNHSQTVGSETIVLRDPDTTDFAINNEGVVTGDTFFTYHALYYRASDPLWTFGDSDGLAFIELSPETKYSVFWGTNGATGLSIHPGSTGQAVGLTLLGSDTNIQLYLAAKNAEGVVLASNGDNVLVAYNPLTTNANYWFVTGSNAGSSPSFYPAGSDTNITPNFADKGAGGINFTSNGNPALYLQNASASVVNWIQISGGTTGNAPIIVPLGETDVSLTVASKNAGAIYIAPRGLVGAAFQSIASAVNYNSFSGSTTGNGTIIANAGSNTDIDMIFAPKGAGVPFFFGTSIWSANASVATVLGSVGPVGSHTTVQEWFSVKNTSGVVRYIPAF